MPDRVSGHVATGILADGDLVLIPNRTLPEDADLEVLIFPTNVNDRSAIDVLDGWKFSRFAVRGNTVATTMKLRHHSTYASQIGEVDGHELGSALEALDGDVLETLTRLGAIEPGIGAIDPAWLAAVDRIERERRRPKLAGHDLESYRDIAPIWCIFFCFCQPHQGG